MREVAGLYKVNVNGRRLRTTRGFMNTLDTFENSWKVTVLR